MERASKMDKKTIKDIEVAGKVVLCRVDFNVPRNKETEEITNDNRVVAALPTINYLLEQAPKCVVLFYTRKSKNRRRQS